MPLREAVGSSRRDRRLAVKIVNLSDLVADSSRVGRVVIEEVQEMLLRLALQTACDDDGTRRERQREGIEISGWEGRYTGRKHDVAHHCCVVGLRDAGTSLGRTAELTGCSIAQVKRVTALHSAKAGWPSTKELV
jgi:hypothetical protein